jgi:hypothetical protein
MQPLNTFDVYKWRRVAYFIGRKAVVLEGEETMIYIPNDTRLSAKFGEFHLKPQSATVRGSQATAIRAISQPVPGMPATSVYVIRRWISATRRAGSRASDLVADASHVHQQVRQDDTVVRFDKFLERSIISSEHSHRVFR